MRSLTLILVTCLVLLWAYFGLVVSKADSQPPVPIPAPTTTDASPNAAELNNRGVLLDRAGRQADALAHLQRAHDFRPYDKVIQANLERQTARVERKGWLRALVAGTLASGAFLFGGGLFRLLRGWSEGHRLGRLRLQAHSPVRIHRDDDAAEIPLKFNRCVEGIVRRHPLTVVWSSSRHGKHMKSQPPVEAKGHRLTLKLDHDRVERLSRYPGDWRGFLYLGRRQVGETAARVG